MYLKLHPKIFRCWSTWLPNAILHTLLGSTYHNGFEESKIPKQFSSVIRQYFGYTALVCCKHNFGSLCFRNTFSSGSSLRGRESCAAVSTFKQKSNVCSGIISVLWTLRHFCLTPAYFLTSGLHFTRCNESNFFLNTEKLPCDSQSDENVTNALS